MFSHNQKYLVIVSKFSHNVRKSPYLYTISDYEYLMNKFSDYEYFMNKFSDYEYFMNKFSDYEYFMNKCSGYE